MLKNVKITLEASKENAFDILEIIEELEQEKRHQEAQLFDKQIETTVNDIVSEAVKHFSKRFRKGDKDDFDERYLYSQAEVDKFFELNKNPNVKVRKEYYEKMPDKIFCYILYR